MHYKKRWYYAAGICLCIFVLGFFYFIKPQVKRINELHIKENNLQEKYAQLKHAAQKKDVITMEYDEHKTMPMDYLKNLVTIAHRHHLIIQTMRVVNFSDSVYRNKIHFVTYGDEERLFTFLFELLQPKSGMVLLNFKYKILPQAQFVAVMDVFSLKNKIKKLYTDAFKILNFNHAFCFTPNAASFGLQKSRYNLLTTPLSQMKMMGYLHEGEHSEGLILLPNIKLVTVKINDAIGRERGVVTKIKREQILIKLSSGRTVAIKLSS